MAARQSPQQQPPNADRVPEALKPFLNVVAELLLDALERDLEQRRQQRHER